MKLIKNQIYTIFIILNLTSISFAEFPSSIVGVIDLNYILSEAKAAKAAAIKIEEIAIQIEKEIQESDQNLIDEQNKLIESQAVMAPEAFDSKRLEYEKKVQNYNVERQNKLISIDQLIANSRNTVLEALKPILEDISNDNGITILLEKNSVLLNDENMDITEEALKRLNKDLPELEITKD